MSGSYLSTIANAVKFNDQVPITSSKNTIAVALLIASSLVFIQRHGKMKTLLRSLSGKMYKCCNQRSAATTMAERMEEEDDLELDCVVCLSRVSPGEKYKILQTCNHGFHVNCIDAWLQKHSSTCPTCRCPVPQTPRNYCSISAQDQDFDALFSYLLRFLDHIQTWLMNPLNALTEECLRLP